MQLWAFLCARGPLKWSLVTPGPRESPGFSWTPLLMSQVDHSLVTNFQGSICLTTPTLALQCAHRTGSQRCAKMPKVVASVAHSIDFSSCDAHTVPGALGPMSTYDQGYAYILILEAA